MIHKCKICGYETSSKSHLTGHMNKKTPCYPGYSHGRTKKIQIIICETCNKRYATLDSLKKHVEKCHPIKNNNTIKNNNGNIINGDVNGNIINVTNNIHVHKYDFYDINDLTLFEQYKFLATIPFPHIILLDFFNLNINEPKYHNIDVNDIKSAYVYIFEDNKWIRSPAKKVLNQIIISCNILFRLVYNRFRIFFSSKAREYIPGSIFKGFVIKNDHIVSEIRSHLHNNRIKINQNIVRIENKFTNKIV